MGCDCESILGFIAVVFVVFAYYTVLQLDKRVSIQAEDDDTQEGTK